MTLAQGATNDKVQVSVTAQNGFAGSVSVTTAGLTGAVTVSPTSLSLTPGVCCSRNVALPKDSVRESRFLGT